MITLKDIIEERDILQSDFDKMSSHIRKVELDLSQMKANMNAVDGALQQMRKLINKAQKSDEKEGKEK